MRAGYTTVATVYTFKVVYFFPSICTCQRTATGVPHHESTEYGGSTEVSYYPFRMSRRASRLRIAFAAAALRCGALRRRQVPEQPWLPTGL
eukprot:6173398-Pleurochrysis_carterae.AAC.4